MAISAPCGKTGKDKLKELLDVNKIILAGVLEELENTKAPDTYFVR